MKVERPRARSSAAPTRLNSRSTTPMRRAVGRHEAAHLRQDRDQRVLAQEGAFARHVGAGQQPQAARSAARSQSLATKGAAVRQCRLDHRMAPADDGEGRRCRRPSGGIAPVTASSASAAATSSAASARAARADLGGARGHLADQVVEQFELERQGLVGGAAILPSSSPSSTVVIAHRRGHGLAMDEVARPASLGLLGRHLDVIAEHVVVADLERGHAGLARHSAPAARRSGAGFRRASARSSSRLA